MTLPPRSALWRAALAGFFGAASGFALFVLWWEENETHERPLVFIGALLAAAGVSFVFESFREELEGHEEKRARLPDTLVTIMLLAIFELFVLGLHTTISLAAHPRELKPVTNLVLGQALVGQTHTYLHLVIMVLLWASAAVILTLGLCAAVFDPRCALPPSYAWRDVAAWGKPTARAAGMGGLTGAVGGPLAVLGYAFSVRAIAEVKMILFDTDAFTTHVRALAERVPLPWNIPIQALRLLFASLGTLFGTRWGPIVALLVSLGIASWSLRTSVKWPALVIGVVYAIPLFGGAGFLIKLALAVATVWALPGIVLGAMIPWLSAPSRYPALWGAVAFVAAMILVGLAWTARDVPLAAGLLAGFGLGFAGIGVALFWRGGAIERYWPILALSVAVNVFGGTRLMQGLDFFNIQKEAYFFSRSPLLTVPSTAAQLGPFSDSSWVKLSQQIQQFATSIDSASNTGRLPKLSLGVPFAPIRPMSPDVARVETAMTMRADTMSSVERTLTGRYERLRSALSSAEWTLRRSDSLSLQDQENVLDSLRADAPRLRVLTDSLATGIDAQLDGALAQPSAQESPVTLWLGDASERARLQSDQANMARRREVFERRLRDLAAATQMVRASVTSYQNGADVARAAVDTQLVSSRRLELAMTASFGFWATIGILAAWAIRRTSNDRDGSRIEDQPAGEPISPP